MPTGWNVLPLHFYEVTGDLVRRWVPPQRRVALEVWNGFGWSPYPDVDNVLRYGQRLAEPEAIALLQETRDRVDGLARFFDDEARVALHDRLRRA